MSLPDKKLEKLQKLLEVANEDYATPADVMQLGDTLISLIQTEKERLSSDIETARDEAKSAIESSLALLTEKETAIRLFVDNLSREIQKNADNTKEQLSKEIARVEKKIPTKTDLSGLEKDIAEVRLQLNDVPREINSNPEAIRNALELLQGDERLDKSAIRGLDELVAELKTGKTDHIIAGVRFLSYLADVNVTGITDGQTIVWDATTGKFIPGTAGSGGGHIIEDEGTPLTQRDTLNFVGAGVTVTDSGSKTVVTISGAGSGAVDSVKGETGVVVLTTGDISDTAQTNKWATAAEKTRLG